MDSTTNRRNDMNGNLPTPKGPRAPITLGWFLSTLSPAAIIAAYRLIPARSRRNWNDGVSTSHTAMAAVLAPGGGWKAFTKYTKPQLRTRRSHSYATAWALLMVSLLIPGLSLAKGQSWAN
jgi:hypothetical protein